MGKGIDTTNPNFLTVRTWLDCEGIERYPVVGLGGDSGISTDLDEEQFKDLCADLHLGRMIS